MYTACSLHPQHQPVVRAELLLGSQYKDSEQRCCCCCFITGQGWFFPTYKRQGVTFDRFLLWEAVTRPPGEVFQHVRKADVHKYQVGG